MVTVMAVVVMMVMVMVAAFGRQLIVRAVAVVRTVIGRRRVLLVVNAALGRVRRLHRRPATQALRHVVIGHQSTTAAATAAVVVVVRRGRRVRRVRHHAATADTAATAAADATDATATADHAGAAAARVVHSHVSRLRTYIQE